MAPSAEDTKQLAQAKKNFAADKNATTAPAANAAYRAPGRLGDHNMSLGTDPRTDANLKNALKMFGIEGNSIPPYVEPLTENSTLEEIGEAVGQAEAMSMVFYENAPLGLPGDESEPEIKRTEEVIKGGDGQDMKLYIYRPAAAAGKDPLPGIVYSHGGGMTIIPTMNPIHDRLCRSIAGHGIVVVMVDFRNAWTKEGFHHFPAGLNDCAAAVQWVHANRQKLNVGSLVLEGESGGGNLALATALKANKEGWIDQIQGVYGLIPYISNAYGWSTEQKLQTLPSLVENDSYFLNGPWQAFMGYFYTPKAADQTNPLAWPYHATVEDMRGLPPHRLTMDELDPLRDEGVSYARRLLEAGVEADGMVNLGTSHGALMFRSIMPGYYKRVIADIASFAKSV